MDTNLPPPSEIFKSADALDERATAGEGELREGREQEFARRKGERNEDTQRYVEAGKDLQGSVGKREQVQLPNPDIGPPFDPKKTESFVWQIFAMSLAGAIGGRGHWKTAAAAVTGAIEGFKAGNLEQAKAKKEEFDREFKTAQEKQKQVDKQYSDVLENKNLSLNMQAKLIEIHAHANQDWDMVEKARQKDFDAMHRRADTNRQRAYKMQEHADNLSFKWATFNEKKSKADSGSQGLSEKYKTDPAYKKQVDFWAEFVKDGNPLPPRFAQSGAGKAMFSDIVSVVPTMGSSKEMRAGQVELAGQKSQARALGTRTAAIEQAASEAREMSAIVLDTSSKFDRTDFPPINKALAAFEKNTGGVAVRQFGAAVNSYINAYARAVNPSGVATVSDKEHAREMLSTADSQDQVKGIIAVLDREMTAAQHSPKNVKEDLRKEITGEKRRAADFTYATEGEATKAAESGELKPGQRVTIGGVPGTWK